MSENYTNSRCSIRPLDYMPQLDSLRGLAVLGVLLVHFVSAENAVRTFLPWGDLGVKLFFVLSGFLITGILLSCRSKVEQEGLSPWTAIRSFYARRFLRLMPLYFLYLLAALVLLPRSREHIVYFATYTVNFLFAFDRGAIGTMTHFWTLAIEEQFYATWPWLVILAPRRLLVPGIIGIVLFAPIFRVSALLAGYTLMATSMMTPSHLDTLGLGALLAVLLAGDAYLRRWGERLMRMGLWAGIPLMAVYVGCEHFAILPEVPVIVAGTATGLFFTWLVGRASVGFTGLTGRVLTAPPLIYLGGISYGLYVIHFHVPGVLREKLLPAMGLSVFPNEWLNLLLFSIVSIAMAAASWRFLESPINSLKRYFPYSPAPARPVDEASLRVGDLATRPGGAMFPAGGIQPVQRASQV